MSENHYNRVATPQSRQNSLCFPCVLIYSLCFSASKYNIYSSVTIHRNTLKTTITNTMERVEKKNFHLIFVPQLKIYFRSQKIVATSDRVNSLCKNMFLNISGLEKGTSKFRYSCASAALLQATFLNA